jgi:DNA primase
VVRAVASPIGGNRVDTEALKLAHPIEEVVARYGVELKRQGRAMVGRCIFHADGGRPNLHIYADSQSWRCYRCGIGGDVVAFVMHAEDVGFREAVDRLTGGHQGPVRPTPRPAPAPLQASRGRNGRTADELAVLQAATNFYHSNLLAEPRALDYLAQRGIVLATARQYRLGFAAADQLLPFLHWQRLPLGAALHLGLLTRAGHEFMADRIVVPELCAGQPVWLIGRALGEDLADDVPKYLGLPGAKPLLGWDQARGSTTVCVVEGVFDVLTVRQWGYPVLGLLGTSVRPDQIDHLRAFARSYLVLDTDDAGVEATLALQETIGPTAVAVALPEDVKDPAELALRPDGQAVFAEALLRAVGTPAPDESPYTAPEAGR